MNMNKINSLLFILLTSCTSEFSEAPALNGQEQETPVQFSISIEQEELGRAAITTEALPDGSEVGIYALKGIIEDSVFSVTERTEEGYIWHEDNIQMNFTNAKYKAETYTHITNQKTYHQLVPAAGTTTGKFPTNGALRFYAYYPYSADVVVGKDAMGTNKPLTPDIDVRIGNSIEETEDYMYTGAIDVPATQNEPVDLRFKHALGRLNIYVHTTKTYRTYPKIEKIYIDTYCSQEGKMNLSTGKITCGDEGYYYFSKDFKNNNYTIKKKTDNMMPIYCNMFIPDNEDQDIFLHEIKLYVKEYIDSTKVYNDAKEITILYDQLLNENIKLYAGKITNLYINYNPKNNTNL